MYGITASFLFSFNDDFSNPRFSASLNESFYGAQIHYDKNKWHIRPYITGEPEVTDQKETIAQQALSAFLLHSTFSGIVHSLSRYQTMQARANELPMLQAHIKKLTEENKQIAQQLQERLFDANADKEFITQWKDLIAITPAEERASLIKNLEEDISKFPACAPQLEQLKQNITS